MKKQLYVLAILCMCVIGFTAFVKEKNVLIVGDSISIGYTPFIQKALAPDVIVEHNDGNGGNTLRGVQRIEKWLGTKQWDVIVFNFGLHDLARIDSLKKYNAVTGKVEVTIDDYKKNLTTIVNKLKETTATVIFVNTTVVPDSAAGRKVEDVPLYNKAAEEVMKKNGIKVIDLYTPSLTIHPANSKPGNVHYTPQGYTLLADILIKAIQEALK